MTESLPSSWAERLATASWRTTLALTVGLVAVMGAWAGRGSGSPGAVAASAVLFALVAGVVLLVLWWTHLGGLRRLTPADRRTVLDAVRFGQSAGDPRLVDPLLAYAARASRLGSRSATAANALALWVAAGFGLFVAAKAGRAGAVPDTIFFGVIATLSAYAARIWPAVGVALRRNVAAAEQAALALRRAAEPVDAGTAATSVRDAPRPRFGLPVP